MCYKTWQRVIHRQRGSAEGHARCRWTHADWDRYGIPRSCGSLLNSTATRRCWNASTPVAAASMCGASCRGQVCRSISRAAMLAGCGMQLIGPAARQAHSNPASSHVRQHAGLHPAVRLPAGRPGSALSAAAAGGSPPPCPSCPARCASPAPVDGDVGWEACLQEASTHPLHAL